MHLGLKDTYPKLYKIESNKNCKVGDLILSRKGTVLNWSRSRQPRRREVVALLNLLVVMSDVKLVDVADSWK